MGLGLWDPLAPSCLCTQVCQAVSSGSWLWKFVLTWEERGNVCASEVAENSDLNYGPFSLLPTLLTKISMRWCLVMQAFTTFSTSDMTVTSAVMTSTVPPSSRSRDAVNSAADRLRSQPKIVTLAKHRVVALASMKD